MMCFLDAAKHPVYSDGKSLSAKHTVKLKQIGVWREYHQAHGDSVAFAHDHIAVLAEKGCAFRFMPMKKALLGRHGLASHWSCTHLAYHSAVK